MVKLIPFRAEHLLQLVSRNPFDDELIDDAWRKEQSPSYTVYTDKPIACAGVILLRPGVGYAWAVFGYDIPTYRVWITRNVRRILRDIIKGCQLHRVEAQVLEEQHAHRKWLEHMGFEPEGVAHDYTSDRRNVVRYEWLRYKVRIQVSGTEVTAYVGDDRVGHASYAYTEEHYAYGTECDVEPAHRGRGIGTLLHKARLDVARRDKAPLFFGMSENPAMIHILMKCGAQRVDTPHGTTYMVRL